MRDGSARSRDWLIAYRCTSHAMREDEGSDVRDRAMVDCLSLYVARYA